MKRSVKVLSFTLVLALLLTLTPSAAIWDALEVPDWSAGRALTVLQASTGKVVLDPAVAMQMDLDGNGALEASDALTVLQIATGKIAPPALTPLAPPRPMDPPVLSKWQANDIKADYLVRQREHITHTQEWLRGLGIEPLPATPDVVWLHHYCGTYNGCVVLYIDLLGNYAFSYDDELGDEIVGPYVLHYPNGQRLIAYKDGAFTSLPDAYAKGWLTDEDVRDIRWYHNVGGLYAGTAGLGLDLLRQAPAGENALISPLSIQNALGMAANGAAGQTLDQMIGALRGSDREVLNVYLQTNRERTARDTDYTRVKTANAVWVKEPYAPQETFTQAVERYYGAEVTVAPFTDETKTAINRWTSDNTDGMIPEILDRINPDATSYLVNTVYFNGKWARDYGEYAITDGTFTAADGQRQPATMMRSFEDTYLSDAKAEGFLRPYKDGYSFMALLPREGITAEEYLRSMGGNNFRALWESAREAEVTAAIPQFSARYRIDNAADQLEQLGMTDAFDPDLADMRGMVEDADGLSVPTCISRVIHECVIEVAETGTKAAGATAVEAEATSAAPKDLERHTVILDRPFVYAIVEDATGLPLFIGIQNSLE